MPEQNQERSMIDWNLWFRRVSEWISKIALPPEQKTTTQTPVRDLVGDVLGHYGTTVLNVGARGGDQNAWWRIAPIANLVGFEPDVEECARLNEASPSPRIERYLPLALGESRRQACLYQTREPACSSLYPPDPAISQRYPQLVAMESTSTKSVSLSTLDDWWQGEDQPHVSLIKLDTQGSELDILKGARQLLEDCLGIEIEVEFSPLYRGQPVFSDVDSFLRSQGFSLWRLDDPCHYSEHPNEGEKGRLYWANAVYLRDYRSMGTSDEQWRKTMLLAVLLEALGDRAASRSCLKQALQGVGEPAANSSLNLAGSPG